MIHNSYVAHVKYPKGHRIGGKVVDEKTTALNVGGAPLDPEQMAAFVEVHNMFPGATSVEIEEVAVRTRPRTLKEMLEHTRKLAASNVKARAAGKPVVQVTPQVKIKKADEDIDNSPPSAMDLQGTSEARMAAGLTGPGANPTGTAGVKDK